MEAVSLCNVYLFLRTHSALGLLCFNQDETLLGWKCTVFQLGWNGVKNVIGVKVYSVSIGMKRCTEWTLNRDWDEAVLGWTCVGMNLHWDDMSRDMVCRAEKMETPVSAAFIQVIKIILNNREQIPGCGNNFHYGHTKVSK